MSIKRAVTVTVVAAAAAGLISCGGNKTAAAPTPTTTQDGFEVATGPEAELDDIKSDMNKNLIASEVGQGSSNRENIALEKAEGDARARLANAVKTQIQSLSENYAQDVNDKAEEFWERVNRQVTNEGISGATTYKKIKLYNKESGQYKYFVLMYVNPELLKKAVSQEIDRDKEIELRVKKEDMLFKLDAAIELQKQKYGR